MTNKYNLDINEQTFETNINRLTNQIWKLIPMRENSENWTFHLDKLIIEIVGLDDIIIDVNFLELISKLRGLRIEKTEFEAYRNSVFESISLLRRVKVERKKE